MGHKTNKMKKAKEIFVRIGFEDMIVPIKDSTYVKETPTPQYLVGYEDAEGNECEEDGTYLNQTIRRATVLRHEGINRL